MGLLSSLRRAFRRLFRRGAPADALALPAAAEATVKPKAALAPPVTQEQAYARAVEAWVALSAREMRRGRLSRWFGGTAQIPDPPAPPPARQRLVVLSGGPGDPGAVDKRLFDEPSVRQFIQWTPDQIRGALISAESGWLVRAALLCEAILGDDRAPAVLNTRANALLGCDLKFEQGWGKKKRAALKALEIEEDFYDAFPEEELRRLLVWGVLLGVGLGEIRWTPKDPTDPASRLIPKLKVWHPRFLRYDWQTHTWFVQVEEYGKEEAIDPKAGKWILFTPYGASRPWAYGLWRGMAYLWLFKYYAFQDWAHHSEVHGMPIRTLSSPPEAGKLDPAVRQKLRQELAADIDNLGSDTSFVPAPGFKLELVEATANTWQMFQAQIEMANRSMSVMAIGGDLATESKKSAGTGANAQAMVRDDYKRSDAKELAACLHDWALTFWAELNFKDRRLAPWPEWQVEPPQDIAALASQFGTVVTALQTLEETSYQLEDGDWIKDTFGFPIVRMAVATPPAPAAKPGTAPAAQTQLPPVRVHLLSAVGLPTRTYRGIVVSIDRPEGFIQSGKSPDGTPWERTYKVDYGFVRGTKGGDGDELDVFCGPDPDAETAYWVVQLNNEGEFDEYKVFLGFDQPEEARACFLDHIPARYFGGLFPMPVEALRAMLGLEPGTRLTLLRAMGLGKQEAPSALRP